MRLGGPVFSNSDDPEELARAHRALGYRAAYCPGLKLEETESLRAVRAAFAKHGVAIAEVGVWNNLMDPEPAKREANLKAVETGLALAEEVGAFCCVNIAGGFSASFWAGPHAGNLGKDGFDLAVENARKVIDAVRPRRTRFTYEMMPFMLPDSADSYLDLMRAIDRPAFGVHLDVVNIVNSPRRYYDTTSLVKECVEKLGPHVASCHLKDIRLQDGLTVHLDEVMVGQGGFDIRTYLREVAGLPQDPPVMLEHLSTEEEYDRARQYVVGLAQEMGIGL
jgi:sugar phosphate isomerase/epimerase